jgi:hypothetical protein
MDDTSYERAKKRMRDLSSAFAYPGAKRVLFKYLLRISQGVYTTTDDIRQVDRWYCEKLELEGESSVGVMFNADGRKWSFFRDGVKYRTDSTLKKGPMTVRQIVGESSGARIIVLALHPPEASVTEISVTVLLMGEPDLAAKGKNAGHREVEGQSRTRSRKRD